MPYEPFVEALRQLPRCGAARAGGDPSRACCPSSPPQQGREPADSDDHATRYLLFDAVARALDAAAAATPLMLVLEDLHWADPPTLLLLRHVCAPPSGGAAARRSRRTAPRRSRAPSRSSASVAELARELPLERIALRGLADDEVAELIGALAGRPSSLPLGSAMRRDTAGNPLFVAQLLRHLDESGVLVERDGELTLMAR